MSKGDMLKFLTQKFRSQTLNEVRPENDEDDEDRDSGTESDEENQDLDDSDCDFEWLTHSSIEGRKLVIGDRPRDSLEERATHEISEHCLDSISCTSDYERQSLDYDHHSSEEELENIHREVVAEKRKRSHVHSGNSDSSGSLDEEVQELMLEPQPVLFSASPVTVSSKSPEHLNNNNSNVILTRGMIASDPKAVIEPEPLLLVSVSPKIKADINLNHSRSHNESRRKSYSHSESRVNEQVLVAKVTVPANAGSRKRHRQGSSTDRKVNSKSSVRRPCLDFEKMQKNVVKKQCTHNVGRAKMVKIQTVGSNSPTPVRCLSDPAVYSFRSISSTAKYGQLTPVEQTPCAY